MATPDEIERRVAESDASRSVRRAAAAKQISELAHRHANATNQVEVLERQLGETLVAALDVIDVTELATFTDIPAADLTRWLESQKSSRAKRKRRGAGSSTTSGGEQPQASVDAPTDVVDPRPSGPRAPARSTP
ncbi:hypothetical protein NLX83_15670 [Allokutzneria sp. A3M-2-11 16]|uniref:hypothetical protein n=1 Tax=Allokutzneria sp. A3M-2-11 16 TaxID=2962043 RepID=UPI0020B83B33|nr:hypothetical protein [Allokutzneria sp. A3M-2-11 16]MCP3800706.1 hypothetical protein [Allokutzneria sp. A3M-2-11 16]